MAASPRDSPLLVLGVLPSEKQHVNWSSEVARAAARATWQTLPAPSVLLRFVLRDEGEVSDEHAGDIVRVPLPPRSGRLCECAVKCSMCPPSSGRFQSERFMHENAGRRGSNNADGVCGFSSALARLRAHSPANRIERAQALRRGWYVVCCSSDGSESERSAWRGGRHRRRRRAACAATVRHTPPISWSDAFAQHTVSCSEGARRETAIVNEHCMPSARCYRRRASYAVGAWSDASASTACLSVKELGGTPLSSTSTVCRRRVLSSTRIDRRRALYAVGAC